MGKGVARTGGQCLSMVEHSLTRLDSGPGLENLDKLRAGPLLPSPALARSLPHHSSKVSIEEGGVARSGGTHL
jgi:hypothetical protein